MESEDKNRCFAFFYRAGRSVNKKWARAVNRMRALLARRNDSVDPRPPLNDTGSPNLILTKRPTSSRALSPLQQLNLKQKAASSQTADSDDISLTSSVLSVVANCAVRESLISIAAELQKEVNSQTVAPDNVSVTSSGISAVADYVVRESLTTVVADLESEVISKPLTSDNISMTSSCISAMAEAAVKASLTSISRGMPEVSI